MALSATIDAKARVTLTTSTTGSSFVWKKDGATFATTATGTVKDQRPDKRYVYAPAQSCTESGGPFSNYYNALHRSTGGNARKTTTVGGQVSFTFTGVEVGVCIDRETSSAVTPSNFCEARIDGGSWERFFNSTTGGRWLTGPILWGKAGLANTSHTVDVRLAVNEGLGMAFDGYFYSDRDVPLGTPVTYEVTIDGVTTETLTVTPRVDRLAVLNGWVDQLVTIAAGWPGTFPTQDAEPYHAIEHMGGIALLYLMTGRAELPGIASQLYSRYVSLRDANGLLDYYYNGTHAHRIVSCGRIPYNYLLAYRAFGDAKYLAVADAVVTTLRNTWPRSTVTSPVTGLSYPGVWGDTFEGAAPATSGNMWASTCFSLGLLYEEPSSVHYQDATVLARIQQNIDWSVANVWDSTNHLWWYSDTMKYPARVYGEWEQYFVAWLADHLGLHTTEADQGAAWLAGFGFDEPDWWNDLHYGGTAAAWGATGPIPSMGIFGMLAAQRRAGVTIPRRFVDLGYSAAFGPGMTYDPRGGEDSTYTFRNLTWDNIQCAFILHYNDVPLEVWGADVTPPTVTGFEVPASPHESTSVAVTVMATDDVGVTAYAVTVDTTDAPTDWRASGVFTIELGEGTHVLRAYAQDEAGNVSAAYEESITITVALPAGVAPMLMRGSSPVRLMRGAVEVLIRRGSA